jgi:MFS family permease
MRLPPYVRQPVSSSAWAGFRESVAFIAGDARVSTLVVLTGLFSVFGFPYLVLMPVFARDVLHTRAAGYGALTAAVGVGALLGALGIAVLSRRIPKGRTLVLGGTSFGLALVLFAASRSFTLSLFILALTGCAMIANNALTNTLLQTLVPDALRGRVMGFYSFVFVGLAPLGALQAGVIAEHYGAPWAVATGGIVTALSMAVAAWRVPALRSAV